MGGSKYSDSYLWDAVKLAEYDLVHCLCTDARLEVERNAEQSQKSSAVLIGKLYSQCKDFMELQKCEFDVIIRGFDAWTSYFSLDADMPLSQLTEETAEMVKVSKIWERKGKELKRRCLKEVRVTELAIADIAHEEINEDEFFELYGVYPEYMTGYVLPQLCHIEEVISCTLIYSERILFLSLEKLRLMEERVALIKERDLLRIQRENLEVPQK